MDGSAASPVLKTGAPRETEMGVRLPQPPPIRGPVAQLADAADLNPATVRVRIALGPPSGRRPIGRVTSSRGWSVSVRIRPSGPRRGAVDRYGRGAVCRTVVFGPAGFDSLTLHQEIGEWSKWQRRLVQTEEILRVQVPPRRPMRVPVSQGGRPAFEAGRLSSILSTGAKFAA